MFNRKDHWEKIYSTKALKEVSWYESVPHTSLEFLKEFNIPKSARIIDIGSGDSFFVDYLLEAGYSNITALDISESALARAKERLGEKAALVNWIVADAAEFKPSEKYDFWHDRAAFHFLTEEKEIENYLHTARTALSQGGVMVLGSFSENGPDKCSGIQVKQYSETSMANTLARFFRKVKCIAVDHITPFNTVQNFLFCSFKQLTHH